MKFKKGDKVCIVRAFKEEDYPHVGYNSSMDAYVGTGQVHTIDKAHSCPERYTLVGHAWTWVEESLELVDEADIRAKAEAIINDALRYRALKCSKSEGASDVMVVLRHWTKKEGQHEYIDDDKIDEAVDRRIENLKRKHNWQPEL